MPIRLEKDWLPFTRATVAGMPGQLGVFELSDENQQVVYIGCAGAASLFGLKSAAEAMLGRANFVRFEVNTAYRTRHRELLMVFHADHGSYPTLNSDLETFGLGVLSPQGSAGRV